MKKKNALFVLLFAALGGTLVYVTMVGKRPFDPLDSEPGTGDIEMPSAATGDSGSGPAAGGAPDPAPPSPPPPEVGREAPGRPVAPERPVVEDDRAPSPPKSAKKKEPAPFGMEGGPDLGISPDGVLDVGKYLEGLKKLDQKIRLMTPDERRVYFQERMDRMVRELSEKMPEDPETGEKIDWDKTLKEAMDPRRIMESAKKIGKEAEGMTPEEREDFFRDKLESLGLDISGDLPPFPDREDLGDSGPESP